MEFSDWAFTLNSAGRVRCEPGWSLESSWSRTLSDCDLWYVWKGKGRMRLRNREIGLQPGVCLWMRPGGRYEATQDPENPLGVTFIHFLPRSRKGKILLGSRELPPEVHTVRDPVFFDSTAAKIVRLLQESRVAEKSVSTLCLKQAECLFGGLVLELLRPSQQADDSSVIERYRQTIEQQAMQIFEQPSETPLVGKLAREAGLSPGHYGRVFRSITGMSPRELIQQARLQRACQLLRETSGSIAEVATQTGYHDVYQFSRLFKKRLGLPPSNWRRQS